MDVVFPIGRQVVVDDQGHLLDINTSGLRRNRMAISYIAVICIHIAQGVDMTEVKFMFLVKF